MRLFGWLQKDECSRTRALVSEYVDGRLRPEERDGVEQHLAACPGCRAELESLRATVALLRGLPRAVPARHFVVVPARPLPGRRSLPALRYATAAVVVLLVAVVAGDWAGAFERETEPTQFGTAMLGSVEGDYWTVGGVRNTVNSDEETRVVLVVPDGTDTASAAVESVSTNGMVYGSVEAPAAGLTQVVLKESGAEAVASGDVEEFAVVSVPSGSTMALAVNDGWFASAFDGVAEGGDGSRLSMVSSDYSALYSFDMAGSERVTATAPRTASDGWLRPVEYALVGLAALLGAAATGIWLWRRKARLAEARVDRDRQ